MVSILTSNCEVLVRQTSGLSHSQHQSFTYFLLHRNCCYSAQELYTDLEQSYAQGKVNVTYTWMWAISLSIVTSCFTCRKRLWLLSTMLSRMSKETCCIDASVDLALTKLAIWKKRKMQRTQWWEGSNKVGTDTVDWYLKNKWISGKIHNLLDKDGREVFPRDYPMIHEFHEACQRVIHDSITPEWHTYNIHVTNLQSVSVVNGLGNCSTLLR